MFFPKQKHWSGPNPQCKIHLMNLIIILLILEGDANFPTWIKMQEDLKWPHDFNLINKIPYN